MSFDLLNPWMLAGLAGVTLPVLAHLLSRRKYDVVEWGAMQFLEIGRNARRRLQLEELLLMLLRMGLIALLAIALARPWMSGGPANIFAVKPASDFAVVIDGSYSTDWRGRAKTPHDSAVAWTRDFLKTLGTNDTVGLIDARGLVSTVLPLSHDRAAVRDAAEALPVPSGASRLDEAIVRGLQLVNTGTNVSRHVIVVTDGQAHPWRDADEHLWLQLRELREQAAVPADVWVVNTQKQQAVQTNYAIDRLELSRELTVIDFPIRVRSRLRNSGAKAASNRAVYLEVDGQRLATRTISVRVEPDGQASVEFEHRFTTPGSHLVSVVIEDDDLPGDNRSDAAITITDALPVLLVDGTPSADPTKSEVFFAQLALSAPGNPTPWVRSRVVPAPAFSADSIADAQVIVLAGVPRLTDQQKAALQDFVNSGGGLAITLNDRTDADWYNATLYDRGRGLLPAWLESLETSPMDQDAPPVTILSESLELPWISRFQAGRDDGFLTARFSNWYRTTLTPDLPPEPDRSGPPPDPAQAPPADAVAVNDPGLVEPAPTQNRGPAVTTAKFTNGDTFLLTRRFGRGDVALLTSSLDADWTTLPARPDYVAFLHELIFQLASGRLSRNVDVGTPLLYPLEDGQQADHFVFIAPDDTEHPAIAAGNELRPMARLDATWSPGIYRLRQRAENNVQPPAGVAVPVGKTPAAANGQPVNAAATPRRSDEYFVVNFDRSESTLTPLTDDQWTDLTAEDRLHRIDTADELFESLKSDTARVELWHILMLVFLAILIGEVWMTRRLVQGGHFHTDAEPPV